MSPPMTLVLFSGGLDSTVLLAWALRRGPVATLTAEYPGRPRAERACADRILARLDIEQRYSFRFPEIPGPWTLGPVDRSFMPGRNLVLHANGMSLARRLGHHAVAAGHLKTDGEEFPDARPDFLRSFWRMFARGDPAPQKVPRLLLPFAHYSKEDVVGLGMRLGAPMEATWSCHRDGQRPCGRCEGCRERADALRGPRRGPRPPRSAGTRRQPRKG